MSEFKGIDNGSGTRMEFVQPGGKKSRAKVKGCGKRARLTQETVRQIREVCKKNGITCDVRFGYETGYYFFKVEHGSEEGTYRFCNIEGYALPEIISMYAANIYQAVKGFIKDMKGPGQDVRDKGAMINSTGPAAV